MGKSILIVAVIIILVVLGIVLFANPDTETVNQNNGNTFNANANPKPAANINQNETTNTAVDSTNVPLNSKPADPTITIQSSGFSPRNLTVRKGDMVRWVNSSGSQVYIAPDEHPSHNAYPGIWNDDGSGDIANGGTYTHSFSTAGIFGYHDHFRSGRIGSITVTE